MATYIQIGSTVTVGSGGAANMQFTSIPTTYTDLLLVWSGRSTTASYGVGSSITFNGSPTYSGVYLQGTGAGAVSATQTILNGGVGSASTATASTFGNASIYIPNYAGTTNKSVSVDAVSENNATNALAFLNAGLATLTSAITSITLAPNDGSNWVQYTTASLYGISKS